MAGLQALDVAAALAVFAEHRRHVFIQTAADVKYVALFQLRPLTARFDGFGRRGLDAAAAAFKRGYAGHLAGKINFFGTAARGFAFALLARLRFLLRLPVQIFQAVVETHGCSGCGKGFQAAFFTSSTPLSMCGVNGNWSKRAAAAMLWLALRRSRLARRVSGLQET